MACAETLVWAASTDRPVSGEHYRPLSGSSGRPSVCRSMPGRSWCSSSLDTLLARVPLCRYRTVPILAPCVDYAASRPPRPLTCVEDRRVGRVYPPSAGHGVRLGQVVDCYGEYRRAASDLEGAKEMFTEASGADGDAEMKEMAREEVSVEASARHSGRLQMLQPRSESVKLVCPRARKSSVPGKCSFVTRSQDRDMIAGKIEFSVDMAPGRLPPRGHRSRPG